MENKIKSYIGYFFIIGMLLIYPTIMHDMYFDITDTKLISFYTIAILLIIAVFIYLFVFGISGLQRSTELVCLAVLFVDVLISFFINGHNSMMLNSEAEHGVGVIFFLTLFLTCASMILLNPDVSGKIISLAAIGGVALVSLISTLQFAGVDFFGMYAAMDAGDRHLFLGTMGNIANLGFYGVVAFPICLFSLSREHSLVVKIAGCFGLLASSILTLLSNTDATILAFATVVLLVGIVALKSENYALGFYVSLLMIGLGYGIVGLIEGFVDNSRKLDSNEHMLLNPVLLGILIMFALVGLILNLRKSDSAINKVVGYACLVGLVGICLIPVVIIVYTLVGGRPDTTVGRVLYFNNNWGTDRGYLWKSALGIFADGSFIQKIFGQGAGSFADVYLNNYYEKALELGLFPNYDAHNNFLQFLCEYGLVGLGSLLALLVLRIKSNFKSDNIFLQLKAISLVGAMIASSFLVFQSVTIGMLPVLL